MQEQIQNKFSTSEVKTFNDQNVFCFGACHFFFDSVSRKIILANQNRVIFHVYF
jgi:hypothetical protein